MSTYKEFRAQTKRRKAKRMALRVGLLMLILALLFAACYVGIRVWLDKSAQPDASSSEASSVPIEPIVPVEPVPVPLPVASGIAAWNRPLPLERTINLDAAPVADYHLLALPQNGKVTKEYFHNALFIGDSLASGFAAYEKYLGIGAMVNGYIGASPKSFIDNASIRGSGPILDEVYAHPVENVHAVYILLGTNVLPSYSKDEQIMKYYYDLLPILKAHFLPSTVFYVQGMPPISAAVDGKRPGMSNERIRGVNHQIAAMAALNGMSYIDLEEALGDEAGYLPEDIASTKDGYHMRDHNGYLRWVDYLQTHTVYDARHAAQYEIAPSAC